MGIIVENHCIVYKEGKPNPLKKENKESKPNDMGSPINSRARLVGRNLDVQSLHSTRFPNVAFRLYLVIIVQPLTN